MNKLLHNVNKSGFKQLTNHITRSNFWNHFLENYTHFLESHDIISIKKIEKNMVIIHQDQNRNYFIKSN
jgi:hypothetical protein